MTNTVKRATRLNVLIFYWNIQTLQTVTMDTRAPCVRRINERNKHDMKVSENLKLTWNMVQQFLSQRLLQCDERKRQACLWQRRQTERRDG